ncbi:helicase RepA family protein [Rhizobium leguminosarum]|uniref:helicase RepA family protein n=1 Tax=Rhizobium leguminosarum TaxID=384 RepID=UPI001030ED9B|nr:helicase RepA family protein [Rhizobium leguminosarum]TBF41491.1 AAA family ATPase [Rhizobium leguminosarum]
MPYDEDDITLQELEMMNRQMAPIEAYELDMRGPPRSPMISEIEWFDDLLPVLTSSYLIKGLLDRGAMSVVYGPSNSGKTFFSLDVAFHVAARETWRDRRIACGTVLYLAAEGGNGIANRIVALRAAHGASNVPLALRRAGLDLLHPDADVPRVIELAGEISKQAPLQMIVVDTLSRVLAGGDENGPADMTAFVKNIDRIRLATGAHIMIVHHTGKDAARGARGHSSLRAATDTEIEITVDEAGIRAATVQKQRDYNGGETFHFELTNIDVGEDQDGDPVRTCIVTSAETPTTKPGRPKLTPSEQVALRAIDDALAEHGIRKDSPDFPTCPIVLTEDWRKHFYRHCDDDTSDAKRQAFGRAKKNLRTKGYIEFYGDYHWRCFDPDQA